VDIFDRLGNLIRTILDDDPALDSPGASRHGRAPYSNDPEMSQAWEELESYMNEDEAPPGSASGSSSATTPSGLSETLRKDFRNLEVPFGAPLNDVRRSYKKLMTAFHPDRHSADPDRFRTATEVTKKLNQSYERIKSHYEVVG
jgi:DnaJ-domain-containing protein 1